MLGAYKCDVCGTSLLIEAWERVVAMFHKCPLVSCEGLLHLQVETTKTMSSISEIVSPYAPVTTNPQGGSQSDIRVRFDLIDAKAMFEMAKVLDHGARKYGENNWRKIPVKDHLNHLLMHAYAYLAGDETDDHLSHILCRATFALGVKLDGGDATS